jgi:UDP-N-acetylglucosamine--N-acetylmuramyl-(pentapeptide) pyrophosphoryl-undecaprenol N-acetylglucosamine transferase
VQADCVAFIDDMAAAYQWADLVLCRAGALTVAELAATGVASVLVPFPYAVDDHQTANARFLSLAGGAILLPQSELTAGSHQSAGQLLPCPARGNGRRRPGQLAKPEARKRLRACVRNWFSEA